MLYNWQDLRGSRFTPAEAETLTGVSTVLQRKWIQLHFASDASDDPLFDISSGGHRRFTFSGLQRLAFFRDVSGDLGTRFGLGPIAEMADQKGSRFSAEMTMLAHSDLFGADLRKREAGDLFIVRSLIDGFDQFVTASAAGLAKLLVSEWGARLYIYNVSLMQRALAEAVQTHKSLKKPLGQGG